jgi:hypothetical protein
MAKTKSIGLNQEEYAALLRAKARLEVEVGRTYSFGRVITFLADNYLNNALLDNSPVKADNESEERCFSVNVNPETLTEVKNDRQGNESGFSAPGIEEFENGFDEELRDGFDDEI